jgi:signal transduction histidine kinase
MKISAIPGALTEFGKATHNSHPCTGLGLPLARRLVELHGGTLNLESKLNFGTTILFTLPATRWQDHSQ